MIDLITYALLKRKISEAATGISSAAIEDGELVFVLQDGTKLNCGPLFNDNTSPIINISSTDNALKVQHLNGSVDTIDLLSSDLKSAALTADGLVLYFQDGSQLLAPISSSGGAAIKDIEIDTNNNLVFSFSDGSTINAGTLPSSSSVIDDTTTSPTTTYSSKFINELMSYDLVIGGGADAPDSFFSDLVTGGGADAPDTDILMDAGDQAW